MNSGQAMVVPLGIKANFNDANRIARLIGRLPTADSVFSKMKGPTVWTTTGIVLPSDPKKVGKLIVDRKAKLCFMPHSNFHENLDRFLTENPGKQPIVVFENIYGNGWMPEAALRGNYLSPDNLPVFGIGSWKAKSDPDMIAVSMRNAGDRGMTVMLKPGTAAGKANCVAPLAVNTNMYPYVYAYTAHPSEEKEVAVEITPEKLAEGIGEKITALKNVLSEDLYFAINALAKAVDQFFRA